MGTLKLQVPSIKVRIILLIKAIFLREKKAFFIRQSYFFRRGL